MTTVLLVRHGRTTSNAAGTLAGWTPGVRLDDTGHGQAQRLAERLAPVPLATVVTSPLERCRQTAAYLRAARDPRPTLHVDKGVGECRYGDWTGKAIKDLAKDPMWRVVQDHPSAAVFPGDDGEAMAAMSARAVAAVRRWNEQLGPEATYAVVSHGDVIKAITADALGLHLDSFQRLHVDPCSVTVITYTPRRPFLVRLNDVGGDVGGLLPPAKTTRRKRATATGDAVVGGGAG